MDSILEIKNLSVTFRTHAGDVMAVRGVDLALRPGEVLGIVGESGSGKSVTSMSVLRLLAENAQISGDTVSFKGDDMLKMGKKQLQGLRGNRISMIFQDPMSCLNPLYRVGKQVAEAILIHEKGVSKQQARERVIELFEKVRIPNPKERYNAYPHELSGGMRQRVMIAMALACKPDILIADEPTTALDVTIQAQILRLLKSIQSETGMSIIFITHDLGVVAEICDRVAVMYGGLIMEQAGVRELFYDTAHPYTLGLMAAVPKLSQDKSAPLRPIPGSPPDMLRPPAGCPFYPRCTLARNICKDERPPYFEAGEGHRSMCWLLSDEAPQDDNPFK